MKNENLSISRPYLSLGEINSEYFAGDNINVEYNISDIPENVSNGQLNYQLDDGPVVKQNINKQDVSSSIQGNFEVEAPNNSVLVHSLTVWTTFNGNNSSKLKKTFNVLREYTVTDYAITLDNYTLQDKGTLETENANLNELMKENYTSESKEKIKRRLDAVTQMLNEIGDVEEVINVINSQPSPVNPTDITNRRAFENAYSKYTALKVYQKSLLSTDVVNKLEQLKRDYYAYSITNEGDVKYNGTDNLTITTNGQTSEFSSLLVDGNTVESTNYEKGTDTLASVTLKKTYLDGLTDGPHTIKFVFATGEAIGSFTKYQVYTPAVEDVITLSNYSKSDENALKEEKKALEKIIDNTYTTEDSKQDAKKRLTEVDAILNEISLIKAIEKKTLDLPETAEPDELDIRDKYESINQIYSTLNQHAKSVMDTDIKSKLNKLQDSLYAYRVIENDRAVYNGTGELMIKANGAASELVRLELDSKEIDPSNYTVVAGSTIVTFKESYLKSLANGTYALTFVYPKGIAVGAFTIQNSDVVVQPTTPTTVVKPNNNTTPAKPSKTPSTGIYMNMVNVLFMALIGFGVVLGLKRKFN